MSKAGWIRTILLVGAVGALELACRTGAIAPTEISTGLGHLSGACFVSGG